MGPAGEGDHVICHPSGILDKIKTEIKRRKYTKYNTKYVTCFKYGSIYVSIRDPQT
jgi:hypothetical protein